ncbi:hypothetical protein CDAR_374481 [Caerostris darwini]|uniref:Reverse transcriptase n=1 Tax=Caerostris darwini TaxID=1538125 RepID=A0AAV4UIG8_9ARAC|nr:hypothetical protein CDAR_374481 [Caerostris darwini]
MVGPSPYNVSLAIVATLTMNMLIDCLRLASPCPSHFIPAPILLHEIKRKINNAIKNYYVTQATGKSWNVLLTNPLPGNLPRHVATANFKLLTSHDYLRGHKYRIGISPSPDCPLCSEGKFMDFNHLLIIFCHILLFNHLLSYFFV